MMIIFIHQIYMRGNSATNASYIVWNFDEDQFSNFGEAEPRKLILCCESATTWRSSFIRHVGVRKRIGIS